MLIEATIEGNLWTTDFTMDFPSPPLKYKDVFGPLSIQESVFHLTVFINPVCFPPKET